jgi:hypothetical protein
MITGPFKNDILCNNEELKILLSLKRYNEIKRDCLVYFIAFIKFDLFTNFYQAIESAL